MIPDDSEQTTDQMDETADMVKAEEIRWTLDSAPAHSWDVLMLDEAETFATARELQQDRHIERELLSEALAQVHSMTVQSGRFQFRIRALLEEVKELRTARSGRARDGVLPSGPPDRSR